MSIQYPSDNLLLVSFVLLTMFLVLLLYLYSNHFRRQKANDHYQKVCFESTNQSFTYDLTALNYSTVVERRQNELAKKPSAEKRAEGVLTPTWPMNLGGSFIKRTEGELSNSITINPTQIWKPNDGSEKGGDGKTSCCHCQRDFQKVPSMTFSTSKIKKQNQT